MTKELAHLHTNLKIYFDAFYLKLIWKLLKKENSTFRALNSQLWSKKKGKGEKKQKKELMTALSEEKK